MRHSTMSPGASERSAIARATTMKAVQMRMVATAAAILECAPQDKSLFDICYASLLEVQGRGSGADLMAAIVGGIVLYRREPVFFKPIWPNPSLTELPFHLIYAGYKTPTPEVIQIVEAWRQQDPARYAQLFEDIDRCVKFTH